jgi:hypothetical protein
VFNRVTSGGICTRLDVSSDEASKGACGGESGAPSVCLSTPARRCTSARRRSRIETLVTSGSQALVPPCQGRSSPESSEHRAPRTTTRRNGNVRRRSWPAVVGFATREHHDRSRSRVAMLRFTVTMDAVWGACDAPNAERWCFIRHQESPGRLPPWRTFDRYLIRVQIHNT